MAIPFEAVPEKTQPATPIKQSASPAENMDALKASKTKRPPKKTQEAQPLPPPNLENCIEINGRTIEIKPTRMRYFRNRTANIYSVLRSCPLDQFLSFKKGTFDESRDSDQILFDFLVAVFDDEKLVKEIYDDLDMEVYEKILSIHGRINHIDEKLEEQRKNMEAQAAKKA